MTLKMSASIGVLVATMFVSPQTFAQKTKKAAQANGAPAAAEQYEPLNPDELHLQFRSAISSIQIQGRGVDVRGMDAVSVDGVVKKLAVGSTEIEMATDKIGVDQGFLTVETKKYGTIRFELATANTLRAWLKPSQKKALLELQK